MRNLCLYRGAKVITGGLVLTLLKANVGSIAGIQYTATAASIDVLNMS
jgi:hypothetical protein